MTQNYTRNQVIEYGLSHGYRARDIDTALKNLNMGSYNPLTYGGNWQRVPGRLVEQGKEIGRNLTTVGGSMLQAAREAAKSGDIKGKFLEAINSDPARRTIAGALAGYGAGRVIPKIGGIGGALVGGTAGLLGGEDGIVAGGKNLLNAVLDTYNTSTQQIGQRDVNWRDIVQGALDNPLYSGIDVLGFGVGKALGKAGKAVASKTGMAQKIFPGIGQGELNRYITNAKLWANQNTDDVYTGYKMLQETPLASRNKIVDSLTKGTLEGLNKKETKIATQLNKDLRSASDILSDMGILERDFSRDNTIAQYAMSNLLDTNLLHRDIMDIIAGRKLRPTAAKMFENPQFADRVLKLLDEGEQVYDTGKTAFLSQKLANSVDPLGEVTARWENMKEGTPSNYARIIGRATAEQQGNVLDATVKMQLDNATRAKQAVETFSDIVHSGKLGVDFTPEEASKYINAFRDSLKRDVAQDRLPDFAKALDNSAIDLALKNGGNPVAYESLKGAFKNTNQSVVNNFNRMFKKNVLGTPAWMVGNRLGNWSHNAMNGVEAIDYADIIKYDKLLPNVLKLQTSYNSYLGLGSELLGDRVKSLFNIKSLSKAITEFKKSYGKFKNSDKTSADLGEYIGNSIGNISNLTASPIFELEAKLEYLDRAANFIRHAKRYAKKNKMKLEDVLKSASKDRKVFFEINTEVNKSLGDYFGRNYALPNSLSDALNLWIPFYRFPVQTIRQTAHEVANYPGRFAANVTIPARGGDVLSNQYMQAYRLDPENYEGGVPYKLADGSVRTLGVTPTPIGMILPRLTSIDKFAGMVNPLFSGSIMNALQYKKQYGTELKTPTSPRYTAMKATNPREALNYKPTFGERAMFFGNELLGTTYNPYIWATRIAPQAWALASGKGMTPFYNTMQSIKYKVDSKGKKVYEFERGYSNIKGPVKTQRQNPEGYKKTLPIELLGGQVGISTRSNFPKRGMSKNNIKKAKSLLRNTNKNLEKNR